MHMHSSPAPDGAKEIYLIKNVFVNKCKFQTILRQQTLGGMPEDFFGRLPLADAAAADLLTRAEAQRRPQFSIRNMLCIFFSFFPSARLGLAAPSDASETSFFSVAVATMADYLV